MKNKIKKNKIPLGTVACAIDDIGNMWFSHSDVNGLYKYSFEADCAQFVHSFENVKYDAANLHSEMKIIENKIYLFPLLDDKIRVYNIQEKKEHSIIIPLESMEKRNYFRTISYGSDVWILRNGQKLFKFDLEVEEIFLNDKICDLVNSILDDSGDSGWEIVKSNNVFFLFNNNNKSLYEISLIDEKIKKINIEHINNLINNVKFYDGLYWIVFEDSFQVISYNLEKDEIVEYVCEENNYEMNVNRLPYSDLVYIESNIILLNYYSDSIKIIDKENTCIKTLYKPISANAIVNYGAVYKTVLWKDESSFFLPKRGSEILIFNNGTFRGLKVWCEKNDDLKIWDIIDPTATGVVSERDYFSTSEYIYYILHR